MGADVTVQVTGSIKVDTLEQLKWLAARDKITLGEAIDRAVANSAFLTTVVQSGGNVLTEESPGKFRKITLK